MQQEVLDKYPKAADLRVYAVWFNMVATDDRERWPGVETLPDSRVAHYWDEPRNVGRWYMERLADLQPARSPLTAGVSGDVLWDVYLVYGPESRWDEAPTGLRRWGRTILRTQEDLRSSVAALLPPNASR